MIIVLDIISVDMTTYLSIQVPEDDKKWILKFLDIHDHEGADLNLRGFRVPEEKDKINFELMKEVFVTGDREAIYNYLRGINPIAIEDEA